MPERITLYSALPISDAACDGVPPHYRVVQKCKRLPKLGTPSYITNMLQPQEQTRTLRSSKLDLLSVPRTDTTLGVSE